MRRFCSICGSDESGGVIRFADWVVPVNTGRRMRVDNMQTVCEEHLEGLNVEKNTNRCRPINEYDELRKR